MHHPLLSRLANDRYQVPPAPAPVRRAALVVAGGELDRRCEECPLFLSGRSPPCPRIEREPIDKTNAKWIGNTTESLKETFPRLRELAHGRTLRKSLPDPEVLGSILCVPEKETLTCDNGPCFSRKMHFSVDGSVAVCVACGDGDTDVLTYSDNGYSDTL